MNTSACKKRREKEGGREGGKTRRRFTSLQSKSRPHHLFEMGQRSLSSLPPSLTTNIYCKKHFFVQKTILNIFYLHQQQKYFLTANENSSKEEQTPPTFDKSKRRKDTKKLPPIHLTSIQRKKHYIFGRREIPPRPAPPKKRRKRLMERVKQQFWASN